MMNRKSLIGVTLLFITSSVFSDNISSIFNDTNEFVTIVVVSSVQFAATPVTIENTARSTLVSPDSSSCAWMSGS